MIIRSPSNKGKSWSKDEVLELETLAAQDTPIRVIAWNLGRTHGGITTKASQVGISLGDAFHRRSYRSYIKSKQREKRISHK